MFKFHNNELQSGDTLTVNLMTKTIRIFFLIPGRHEGDVICSHMKLHEQHPSKHKACVLHLYNVKMLYTCFMFPEMHH